MVEDFVAFEGHTRDETSELLTPELSGLTLFIWIVTSFLPSLVLRTNKRGYGSSVHFFVYFPVTLLRPGNCSNFRCIRPTNVTMIAYKIRIMRAW
ncbi:unnamed protein product [Schistosoma curassoni]|uniref:Uncharacterized protein n=1 Tax=Schistosoma curassoni TaxID=6186 RepID=A0A183JGH2_9TREM|nr:unnamed protein product [Schistosoma curassoni]